MKKELLDNLILRIKKDKKLLFILLLGVSGIILIVFSSSESKENVDTKNTFEITTFNEFDYTADLEKKLIEMITLISGAGNAKVIITLDCDYETVYAKDVSLSTDDNSTDEDSEYIIIDQENNQSGLLLKTVTPKVRGVAVVFEGGDNQYVRNAVREMLKAVLEVGVNQISVSKLNS